MTQKQRILDYLKSGKRLTPLEALDLFGCMRLASAVHELKQEGHDIRTTIVGNDHKRWAQYYLEVSYRYQPKYEHQLPGYAD